MKKMLRKILSVSLCAAMLAGTAAVLPAFVPDSSITASAAETYGDYEYTVENDAVTITKYTGKGTAVTIPSKINGKTVTAIGWEAFEKCSTLTSVIIPNGVVNIGFSAFYKCSNLKSVSIPDSVTDIYYSAFEYCTSLTKISVGSSNQNYTVSDGMLFDKYKTTLLLCPADKTTVNSLPSTTRFFNVCAFYNCTNLTSITIPSEMVSFGAGYFSECPKLANITIDKNNKDYTSENNIVYTKDKKTLVLYPRTRTTVTDLPDTLTKIGQSAFQNCTALTKITIPKNVTTIESIAFDNCKSLTEISIPSGVTSIGAHAFGDCTSLKSIKIPDGVTTIEGFMFNGCSNLTSITFPAKLTTIGDDSFWYCTSLTNLNIPDGVTSIGKWAFYNCTNLTSITIPSSVTDIGNYAFGGCKNLTIYGQSGSAAEKYAKDNDIKFVSTSASSSLKNNSTISAASVAANTDVTMTGKASGGTSPYKFAYYYKKSTESTYTKAYVTASGSVYTKNTSVSFKPTTAGTYNVKINVKDDKGTVVQKDFNLTVTAALKNSSTISATTVAANTAVTMAGKASGGTSPYKFAYYYKKSTDSTYTKAYVTASGSVYTKNTSVSFKPTTAGTYNVKINAKDDNGTVVSKEFTVKVTSELKNSSTISATSVTANTAVTMTGKASGGTSPYKFAYYYKKSTDSTYTKAYVTSSGSAYTKNTSVSFKPATAGTYNVKINAKDDNGTVVSKEFTVKVTAELKNSSIISATSVKAGTEITMTGKATGGTSPYKYAYYYKKSTDSTYTKAYVTSSGSAYTKYDSVKFTPKTAGTYNVKINVKDQYGEGTVVSKEFTLTVK